ncbi:hypothetical protein MRX96_029175 [Rhipicephalus microplus]
MIHSTVETFDFSRRATGSRGALSSPLIALRWGREVFNFAAADYCSGQEGRVVVEAPVGWCRPPGAPLAASY